MEEGHDLWPPGFRPEFEFKLQPPTTMHLDFRCLCSIGLGLALAGGILLGVFGSLLIRPYMYAQDFDKVTCSVQSNALVANVCCVADVSMQECSDWYPCLRILVSYSGDTIVTTNGVLFRDHESVAYQKNNSTVKAAW